MTRVLMLGWEYPPYVTGGLAPATAGIVGGLLANGVDVTLILPTARGIPPQAGLTIVGADMAEPSVPGAYGDGTEAGYGDLFAAVRRYAHRARTAARELEFDIIHAHDWLTAGAAMAIADDAKLPWLLQIHATQLDRAGEHGNRQVMEVEQAAVAAADRVIAVSAYTRELLIQRYGADPARVAVVHNAIETAGPVPRYVAGDAHRPLVLFLGRVTFQKGPDYFIEAARWVLSQRDDVLFVIAGEGDMRARLMEHVAGLGLGGRILFAGFVQPDAAARLYAMADVYVMPSVSEPFGISALEAMRAGTPVIVSRHAGVREIAPHVLEVDFWDVRQMADRILAALDYEHLREALTERSYAALDHWTWADAGSRLARLYDLTCMSVR